MFGRRNSRGRIGLETEVNGSLHISADRKSLPPSSSFSAASSIYGGITATATASADIIKSGRRRYSNSSVADSSQLTSSIQQQPILAADASLIKPAGETSRRPSSLTKEGGLTLPSVSAGSSTMKATITSLITPRGTGNEGTTSPFNADGTSPSLQRKYSDLSINRDSGREYPSPLKPPTPRTVGLGGEGEATTTTSNNTSSTFYMGSVPLSRKSSKESMEIAREPAIPPQSSLRSIASSSAYSSKPRGLVGLDNLGNTCFMNSILQCLSNIPYLTKYFISKEYCKDINRGNKSKGLVAESYAELLTTIWTTATPFTSTKPSRVKQIVGTVANRMFMGYEQHDSQEFLRFFLDALHEDLNKITTKVPYQELKDIDGEKPLETSTRYWSNYNARNNSIPKDIFCGQLRSTTTCKTCGKKSIAYDPFWDLSLPIPKGAQIREKKFGLSFGKGSGKSGTCSIADCLKAFTEEEELAGDDAAYCSSCKTHTASTKSICLFRLPKVLVLHIKRFSFNSYRREKLTTNIDIPLKDFSVKDYCSPDTNVNTHVTYSLVAVSNHMGGLGGGHYTANCINSDDGMWYSYNDSLVSKCAFDGVASTEPYLLFYACND